MAARPQWVTLKNGAKSYIDAVMKEIPPNHVFLSAPVRSVTNEPGGHVRLHLENGSSEVYDHVILATHGNQAMSIVRESATDEEVSILSAFRTSENTAVLHSDTTLMPERESIWSSWNYQTLSSSSSSPPLNGKATGGAVDQVSLTYSMNILQHIPRSVFGDVLVTLNPLHPPAPETVQGTFKYAHPLYTLAAVRAQRKLSRIQNTRGISYAGAWTGYGFHEDGFSSGLKVAADHLGAKLPFEFVDSTYSRGKKPVLGMGDLVVRFCVLAIQICIIDVLERLFSALGRKVDVKANGEAVKTKEA